MKTSRHGNQSWRGKLVGVCVPDPSRQQLHQSGIAVAHWTAMQFSASQLVAQAPLAPRIQQTDQQAYRHN